VDQGAATLAGNRLAVHFSTTWTAACRDRADATARAAPDRDRDCEPSGLRSVTGGRSGSYGLDGAPRAGSCE
jgi:hypothetical protein